MHSDDHAVWKAGDGKHRGVYEALMYTYFVGTACGGYPYFTVMHLDYIVTPVIAAHSKGLIFAGIEIKAFNESAVLIYIRNKSGGVCCVKAACDKSYADDGGDGNEPADDGGIQPVFLGIRIIHMDSQSCFIGFYELIITKRMF